MGNRKWEGETVVCIASGPSLHPDDCAMVAAAQSAGKCKSIVVNSSCQRAPFASVLYAGDYPWWAMYVRMVKEKRWAEFAGEKWTVCKRAAQIMHLNHVQGYHTAGVSKRAGTIHLGGNSGYAALNLAVEFGASRVILLGYDMQRTNGASHWHGDHPAGMGNSNNFKQWGLRFDACAPQLVALGLTIENATRQTALKCFPRVELVDALGSR